MVRKSTKRRTTKTKKANKSPHNQLEQELTQKNSGHSSTNPYEIMTKMSGVKSNPIGELASLTPDLYDMILHIRNSVNLQQVKGYADVKAIPEAARTSLAVFFVDWGGNDLNHEEYINNITSGFSQAESLQMGDLLFWCMGGGTTRQEWKNIIEKTSPNKKGEVGGSKKNKPLSIPLGLNMQDLVGLHVELLNMLPQKKYTHYTLNQLFLENRTIYDSLFDTFVALDPMEHDTLQVLEKIVKMGNIERFRLAMMHGTKGKIRSMLREGTFGANLLEAFGVARKATEAYSRGEYDDARQGLERLQSEFGLSPDLFQLGLRDMFVIHAGAVKPSKPGKDAPINLKGANIPLLVSIDKTVGPGSGWHGINHIRDAMSGPAAKYNNNGQILSLSPQLGTPGGRIFTSNKGAAISTDWLYFFAALNTKKLKELNTVKLTEITEGEKKSPGLQGDQRTARLLIHARLDDGFEDLVPKGTLTVTVRSVGQTQEQAKRKADRRSVQSRDKGGKKKQHKQQRKQNQNKPQGARDIMGLGTGAMLSLVADVDLIFEDYGAGKAALFKKADRTQGGVFEDKAKVSPTQLDEADDLSAQEMYDQMQPSETTGIEEPEIEEEVVDDEADVLFGGTRRRSVKTAKGGGRSMGQTFVIELTPKSSIKPSTAREDANWLKMIKKTNPDISALYDKFAKESSRTPAQDARVKKGKKKGEGITGGSYLVYKGGQTKLRMVKARRKDNDEFVPWLLMIPHILVRHGNEDKLEAKKGSASFEPTKKLLKLIEAYFGTPKFKTNLGMGGFRLISERTARKLKQSGSAGKKVVDLALHEGVKKIFTTPGLTVNGLTARPSRYKIDGNIMYQVRNKNGSLTHMEQKGEVKV